MAAAELPEMPNGPILELHGQRKRFHVPHGLKPLLEEMTREVLRYQPDDIYVFLAKYMDAKLSKRKASSTNKDKNRRKSWNDPDAPNRLNEQEIDELLEDMEISKEQADHYATKIQAAFRGHSARKSLTEKGKKLHKDHRKSWEWKKWSWEGPSTLSEEQLEEMLEEYNVTLPVANKYATKIQAQWRGHAVRKSLGGEGYGRKSLKKQGGDETSESYEKSTGSEGSDPKKAPIDSNKWPKKSIIATKSLKPLIGNGDDEAAGPTEDDDEAVEDNEAGPYTTDEEEEGGKSFPTDEERGPSSGEEALTEEEETEADAL